MATQAPPTIVQPGAGPDPDLESFAGELRSPPFVAELLRARGISDVESARDFFLANYEEEDPFKLKGMAGAVAVLKDIRQTGEKILVHGDYDVDGISGAALLYLSLARLGFNADWFLPNRFRDGYGLTLDNLEKFAEQGVQWILTVDTGINAVSEIRRAGELGMQVIITDHHQAGVELPPARVILNPNQPGCEYPNKQLCGTGVAHKLISAYCSENGAEPDPEDLIFVALASLADIMTMRGENRAMVRKGLRLLQRTSRPGFREIITRTSLGDKTLNSTDILFKITPLLNAAGRLSGPEIAFNLLSAESEDKAAVLMDELWSLNSRRKELDRAATAEAREMIDQIEIDEEQPCLVMASEDWHEGVIGIVAAKLVDKYSRPAFVLSVKNGMAKGSGRTVEGFHLYKALATCPELLVKWGGHYFACGFTIKTENIPEFKERMRSLAGDYLRESPRVRTWETHVRVPLAEINEDSMMWLARFEPTGPANANPLFYTDSVYAREEPRLIGGDHLKLTVTDGRENREVIAFGLGSLKASIRWDKSLRLAYYPEWNHYMGRRTIQLRAVAIEESA